MAFVDLNRRELAGRDTSLARTLTRISQAHHGPDGEWESISARSAVVLVDLDWADDGSVSATLRGTADFDDGE